MQPNVDIVNILQIRELAAAMGVNLNWVLPIGSPSVDGSRKIDLLSMATILSNQIGSVTVPDPVFYTPPAGESSVSDATLNGADYSLFKWGVGPLKKGEDWQNDVVGGGWRLIDSAFTADEVYVVFFKPRVSNILSSPDAVARFTAGIRELTSSTTLSAADYRKLIVMKGAEFLTLPSVASYPPNVALFIVSDDGPRFQSTIQTQSGETIKANSGNYSKIFIGQREFVTLITDGVNWYVQSASPAIFAQPTVTHGWYYNAAALNVIPATGGTYLRADRPRTWAFITALKAIYPSAVTTGALWANNRTLWGEGNGSTNFNVPDLRGYHIRGMDLGANVDVDRNNSGLGSIPGTAQADAFRLHSHNWGARNSDNNLGGADYVASSTAPAGLGYLNLNTIISEEGGSETRGINAAFYPLINT